MPITNIRIDFLKSTNAVMYAAHLNSLKPEFAFAGLSFGENLPRPDYYNAEHENNPPHILLSIVDKERADEKKLTTVAALLSKLIDDGVYISSEHILAPL